MKGLCVPNTVVIDPLRLQSDFRELFGDPHSALDQEIEPILDAACYEPRVYHAPDNLTETTGVANRDYLEYMLVVPPGSFLLAFLHSTAGANSNVNGAPPPSSTYVVQITDVGRNYRFFQRPVPEAFFLPGRTQPKQFGVFAGGLPYVATPCPRLLTKPYPIAPPGEFKIEFWNQLTTTNALVQLSILAAVPLASLGYGG